VKLEAGIAAMLIPENSRSGQVDSMQGHSGRVVALNINILFQLNFGMVNPWLSALQCSQAMVECSDEGHYAFL